MMKLFFTLLLVCAATHAATTNLQYSVGQINTALGHALDNSNTVARVDALDTFVAGSNGFANIEYTTAQISNSLANAMGWTNAVARIDTLEASVLVDQGGLAEMVVTNVVLAASFSAATYITIDLSATIGTNRAVVMVSAVPTQGTVSTDARVYIGNPDYSDNIFDGVGFAWLQPNMRSQVFCSTSAQGLIRAVTTDPVELTLELFFRERSQP